ncbi:MAG: hypothetical protein GQ469_01140 [Methanosarcinales archaeon]|nr:hypothetical protein [Methanosarcinales archaeon]
MDNIFFIFDAIDFIVRLMIVVIFFFIASTMKKIDPDVIRSRLFLEYDQIIKAFNMMFVGSIFFFIAAVIEYLIDPAPGDDMVLIMKISLTVFQITVIYFIFILNTAISAIGRRGM